MEDITVEELTVELNALRICVAQLEAAVGAAADTENGKVDNAVAFRRGVRIRITNRVKRPSNWNTGVVWEEDKERAATVTRILPCVLVIVPQAGVFYCSRFTMFRCSTS